MDPERLLDLLRAVADGQRTPDQAARDLETLPFAEVASTAGGPGSMRVDARVDHHRAMRTGFPEVIFCQGKTPEQVAAITSEILAHGDVLLATRATLEHFSAASAVLKVGTWVPFGKVS